MVFFLNPNSLLHEPDIWSYNTSSHYKSLFDLNDDLANVEQTPLPETGAGNETVYGRKISEWIEITEKVSTHVKTKTLNKTEKAEYYLLEQQLIALKARTKTDPPPVLQADADRFRSIILKYCNDPKIHPRSNKTPSTRSLTGWNRKITKTIKTQPLFVQAILRRHTKSGPIWCKDEWTAKYVKWSLRSGASDDVFVKTPNEVAMIQAAHLDKRSGAVSGEKGFCFQDINGKQTLCMLVDGQYQAIQGKDHKEKTLSLSYWDPRERVWKKQTENPYTLKIKDIFAQFRRKTGGYEEVEWTERGVVLWNAIKLGSYDPTTEKHLSITNIDEIPPFKTITSEELSKRYEKQLHLQPGQWALAFCVTRLTPDDNISDCHAYIEVVRPKDEDPTQFEIVPIGHQPFNFPQTLFGKLFSLGNTMKSGMHIFDESYFLSHRERTAECYVFEKDSPKIDRLKTMLEQSIAQGKEGAMVFQPTWKNCAYWVQNIYRRVILHDFSSQLTSIAQSILPENGASRIQRVFSDLNDDSLNAFIDDLIRGANSQDIQNLYTLLRHYVAVLDPSSPTDIQLQFVENYAQKDLKRYLANALKIAIRTQRLFKQDPCDAHYSNFLWYFARFIQWFSTYLRNKIISVLTFLFLGSWRWLRVRDVAENGSVKTSTHYESRWAKPDHYLYLPTALFKWQKNKSKRIYEMRRLLAMMGAAALRPELPPHSRTLFALDELLSVEDFKPLRDQTKIPLDMIRNAIPV